jgi:endonuclease/exonuclease/phosphatase family metal-dependent hydrolase
LFNKNLRIIGTHLEVDSSKYRIKDTREILEFCKNEAGKEDIVILGDFNAKLSSKEMKLAQDYGFESVFNVLETDGPEYTVWAGTVIDHIFFLGQTKRIKNAFVYHTDISDHIPVVVDISI